MNHKNFPRPKGSQWRKWDLHVHTPASIFHKYSVDQGTDVWEKFIADLESLPKEFKVIGINDYIFIEGYEKVLEYKKKGRLKNIDLILPVIEMRIQKFAGNEKFKRINYHIIFSNELEPIIIKQQFLNRIYAEYKLSPEHTNLNWNGAITFESLADFGRLIRQTIPVAELVKLNETDLKLGFNNINFSEEKIAELLNSSYLKDRSFTAIGKAEWDQFEWNDGSIAEKKSVINSVDFVFIASEDPDHCERAKHKLHEQSVNTLLVDCSDAHYFSDQKYKDRIGNCFTWIKVDPTFEGLRQVIYEPQDRIKMQLINPEEKKSYFIIDKVRFIDNTGENNFPSDYIELNPDLTNIIGGKSTGKSLLLYYVAKTIDRAEVVDKITRSGMPAGDKYSFDDNPDFNFEVVWSDGESNFLKQPIGSDEPTKVSDRRIVYIPQSYLNELSEISISSRNTVNKFIEDVLIQNSEAKEHYDNFNQEVSLIDQRISKNINEFFALKADAVQLEVEINKLGDPKGIINYVGKLSKEIESIKSNSGLAVEEIKQYNDLANKYKSKKTEQGNAEHDKLMIKEFENKLRSLTDDIYQLKNEYSGYLIDPVLKQKYEEEYNFLVLLQDQIKGTTEVIIKQAEDRKILHAEDLKKLEQAISPYIAKVKLHTELQNKLQIQKSEQEKLDRIGQLQKDLANKKKSITEKQNETMEQYKWLADRHESLRNEFKKYESNLQDLQLTIVTTFNDFDFNTNVVKEFLNKNTLKSILPEYAWDEAFEYKFDPQNHISVMQSIYEGIIDGKIKTIKDKTVKDAVLKLFENRFYLDFRLTFKNDALDKMSPGKKGLVLLKLLIELSQDEWPILLDQPEDDLDNRSVYYDLVSFIKAKKIKRQIIIVTHNPNLVVGADSEEVIVANQEGQEPGRENPQFRFDYVSGALESMFEDTVINPNWVLYKKGIRQHVCEILEGGKEAFQKREQKYHFR